MYVSFIIHDTSPVYGKIETPDTIAKNQMVQYIKTHMDKATLSENITYINQDICVTMYYLQR